MKNNFSSRVQLVVKLSQEEAIRLGHDYIGTEHLLLGLIREGEGVAVKVLKNLGVELEKEVGHHRVLVQKLPRLHGTGRRDVHVPAQIETLGGGAGLVKAHKFIARLLDFADQFAQQSGPKSGGGHRQGAALPAPIFLWLHARWRPNGPPVGGHQKAR